MIKLDKKILLQALDGAAYGLLIARAGKTGWPIVYANPHLAALTGFDAAELAGRKLADLVQGGDLPRAPHETTELLAQQWHRKGGGSVAIRFAVSPLYKKPGQPEYLLLSECPSQAESASTDGLDNLLAAGFSDSRGRYRRSALTDAASGLVNRPTFERLLQREWAIARRDGGRVGLVLFELDDFGNYVELFGRHAAESVLRKVGHAISGALRRESDVAARYSHERFAVLVGGAEQQRILQFAGAISTRIRKLAIHHPRSRAGRFITVSHSLASAIPDRNTPYKQLMEDAERKLQGVQEDLSFSRDRVDAHSQ